MSRLNELDKTEWFDVLRQLQPDLTWGEYELLWNAFQEEKRKRALQ